MAVITYKAFCENNPDPILSQTDETVQSAVYDWFKYRYIGFEDTSKFLDILRRNCSINYPIYQQKLRLEPGISEYDWMVSDYRERQLKTKGATTGSTTRGQDITNTSETDTTSGTVTHGHTVTTTGSGNDSNIRTGGQTTTKSGDQSTVKSGSDTHVKTGGHTTTDTQGLHTQTTSPHVQRVTTEDGGDHAWSGDTQVQSSLPMSKTYSSSIQTDTSDTDAKQYYEKAYNGLPAQSSSNDNLDWSTLSQQAQSGHREYHDTDHKTTESYTYGDGVKGDIVTNQGDKDDPDTNEVVYNSETDTNTYSDVTDKTTYNNVVDKTEYNSITDSGTHSNTQTVTNGGIDTNAGDSSKIGTTTNTYGNIDTTGSDERTDREQVTGRNEDPATLLFRATAFIEQSSAFKWFKEQIDYCFYPGYYTEDDERSAFI